TILPKQPRLKRDGPATVTFSTRITGNYEAVRWDFGDGSTSGRLAPSHVYSVASNYTVRVTVSNADNQESVATVQMLVLPPPPWWYMLPEYMAVAFVAWAVLIVPLALKP